MLFVAVKSNHAAAVQHLVRHGAKVKKNAGEAFAYLMGAKSSYHTEPHLLSCSLLVSTWCSLLAMITGASWMCCWPCPTPRHCSRRVLGR